MGVWCVGVWCMGVKCVGVKCMGVKCMVFGAWVLSAWVFGAFGFLYERCKVYVMVYLEVYCLEKRPHGVVGFISRTRNHTQ